MGMDEIIVDSFAGVSGGRRGSGGGDRSVRRGGGELRCIR